MSYYGLNIVFQRPMSRQPDTKQLTRRTVWGLWIRETNVREKQEWIK